MPQPTPTQLKTYIDADAEGLGLPGMSNVSCSRKLNERGAVTGQTVSSDLVSAVNIAAVLVSSDEDNLTANEQSQLIALLTPGEVDINASGVQSKLDDLFGSTTTRTNLEDLETRLASPAEAEWGKGITISSDEVEIARRDG